MFQATAPRDTINTTCNMIFLIHFLIIRYAYMLRRCNYSSNVNDTIVRFLVFVHISEITLKINERMDSALRHCIQGGW